MRLDRGLLFLKNLEKLLVIGMLATDANNARLINPKATNT